jgi:hypothetical protein
VGDAVMLVLVLVLVADGGWETRSACVRDCVCVEIREASLE